MSQFLQEIKFLSLYETANMFPQKQCVEFSGI